MRRTYTWIFALAVAVIAADQISKYFALAHLSHAFEGAESPLTVFFGQAPPARADGYHFAPTEPVVLAQNYLQLRYAENPGAAFGLFRNVPPALRGPMFHVISLGAVALIGYYLSKLTGDKKERFAKLGLPLVLGGALGNFADRLARGFVIDYIEAHWHQAAYWPAFNVADSAICVGVGLLLIDSFVRKDAHPSRPT